MALGTQLSTLVDMLRAEIGASIDRAQGVNHLPALKQTLSRTQERLWFDFDWPFAYIERDEPLQDGQRYYTFDNDIDFNRIVAAHMNYAQIWRGLEYGITPGEYNQSNPELGMKQDPIRRWRHWEGNQFEVWPVPSSSTTRIRFRAIKRLNPLVQESDRAELDDQLIVLYAAVELLQRAKSEDAASKKAVADQLYARLKGLGIKQQVFTLGGGLPNDREWNLRGARILPSERTGR